MATSAEQVLREENEFLKSTFPVLVPAHPALTYDTAQFDQFLKDTKRFKGIETQSTESQQGGTSENAESVISGSETLVSAMAPSTTGELRHGIQEMDIEPAGDDANDKDAGHPFMKALHSNPEPPKDMTNRMLTENNDLTNTSTTEPLLDLFAELEEVVSGPRLNDLLAAAWNKDSLSTLKIIFNARSIHLGKSSRAVTYKCFGWLAYNHPVTLLKNLQWLSRPLIEKKMDKEKEKKEDDDEEWIEVEKNENDPSRFDVKNGVAHGYWKDLLNILALASDGKLNVMANPRDLTNIEKGKKKDKQWDQAKAKELRTQKKTERHEKAVRLFHESSFYRALHLTVARVFAEQLKSDLALLKADDKKAVQKISLCAKWAPSIGLFHDKHTFIVSSIAEVLHPHTDFSNIADRELYLRHAREAYRKDISALRKSLEVVERDITAETFENIKYERVPSLAMNRYKGLFADKDHDHFEKYIDKVATGQASISGAVLLPSTLVSTVRASQSKYNYIARPQKTGGQGMLEEKKAAMNLQVIDGQWKTLVQRIKDSGKLENSIAVADVSGSMTSPRFPDGTCPIDSAIGLSLLLAEVTAPPFGGTFITFSSTPTVQPVQGDTFSEKVKNLESAEWGMSTDVVAVFRNLILPLAQKHKLKQEDMVKQVFIFSDMQFNQGTSSERWTSSYDRIKRDYANAGYEMPNLVFWNLAGGRAGMTGRGNPIAPKPVTAADEGTSLVSGYSQGMLKVFLDNGSFEDPEAVEEVVTEEAGEDGEMVQVKKKQKMDPMSTLRKAISHKSYSMLQVID